MDTIDWQGTQIEDRGYDAGGRLTSVDRAHTDETRTYDLANRVASIENTSVGKLDYTYDSNGNKLSETWDGVMAPWSFTTEKSGASQYTDGHDAEDRFRRFIRDGQSEDTFMNRSAIGNISDVQTNNVSELRSFNAVHELATIGSNTQQFDANGNVTVMHTGTALAWDFDNKLQVSTPTGGGASTVYEYNALGKRIRKGSTVYTHSGPNCIAEYVTGSAPSAPTQEYVYADEIDSLVMLSRINDTQHLVATRNQQWSVVSLADNSNGNVVEHYSYDKFGKRRILNGSAIEIASSQYANPYGYTSRYHDGQSNLMFFRARCYDPTIGEFTSRDPLEYVDGMSLMRGYFVASSIDPTGLYHQSEFCKRLAEKISNVKKRIKRRQSDLREDPLGLPEHALGDDKKPSLSKAGHRKLINMDKALLAKLEAEYTWKCRNKKKKKKKKLSVFKKCGKKGLKACARKIPVLAIIFFCADTAEGGVGHACEELVWPLGEIIQGEDKAVIPCPNPPESKGLPPSQGYATNKEKCMFVCYNFVQNNNFSKSTEDDAYERCLDKCYNHVKNNGDPMDLSGWNPW